MTPTFVEIENLLAITPKLAHCELHCNVLVFRSLCENFPPADAPEFEVYDTRRITGIDVIVEASYPPGKWRLFKNGKVIKESDAESPISGSLLHM